MITLITVSYTGTEIDRQEISCQKELKDGDYFFVEDNMMEVLEVNNVLSLNHEHSVEVKALIA